LEILALAMTPHSPARSSSWNITGRFARVLIQSAGVESETQETRSGEK